MSELTSQITRREWLKILADICYTMGRFYLLISRTGGDLTASGVELDTSRVERDECDIIEVPVHKPIDPKPASIFPFARSELTKAYGQDILADVAKKAGVADGNALLYPLITDFSNPFNSNFLIWQYVSPGELTMSIPHRLTGKVYPEQTVDLWVSYAVSSIFKELPVRDTSYAELEKQKNLFSAALRKAIKGEKLNNFEKGALHVLFPRAATFLYYQTQGRGDLGGVMKYIHPDILAELINDVYAVDRNSGQNRITDPVFCDNLSHYALIGVLWSGKLNPQAAHDILTAKADQDFSARLLLSVANAKTLEKDNKEFFARFTPAELAKMTAGLLRIELDEKNEVLPAVSRACQIEGWIDLLTEQRLEDLIDILFEGQKAAGQTDPNGNISRLFAKRLYEKYGSTTDISSKLNPLIIKAVEKFKSILSDNQSSPNEKKSAFLVLSGFLTAFDRDKFEELQKKGLQFPQINEKIFADHKEGLKDVFGAIKSSDYLARFLQNLAVLDRILALNFLIGLNHPKVKDNDDFTAAFLGLEKFILSLDVRTAGNFLADLIEKYPIAGAYFLITTKILKPQAIVSLLEGNKENKAKVLGQAVWRVIEFYLNYERAPIGQNPEFYNFVVDLWSKLPEDSSERKPNIWAMVEKMSDTQLPIFLKKLLEIERDIHQTESIQPLLGELFSFYCQGNIKADKIQQDLKIRQNEYEISVSRILNTKFFEKYGFQISSYDPQKGIIKVKFFRHDDKQFSDEDAGELNDSWEEFLDNLQIITDLLQPSLISREARMKMINPNYQQTFQAIKKGEEVEIEIASFSPLLQAGVIGDVSAGGVLFHMEWARRKGGNIDLPQGKILAFYEGMGAQKDGLLRKQEGIPVVGKLPFFSQPDYKIIEYQQHNSGEWWIKVELPMQNNKTVYIKVSDALLTVV